MRKMLLACLILLCCVSMCGCSLFMSRLERFSRQEEIAKQQFQETVHAFFSALDFGDKDAVKALFSEKARTEDADFDAQIDALFLLYPGPTDVCTCDQILQQTGMSKDDGKRKEYAAGWFPVISNGVYYWCALELVYKNEFDETEIGISWMNFYTADAYCGVKYDELEVQENTFGLTVYSQKDPSRQVRVAELQPYWFDDRNSTLNGSEVVAQLNKSNKYSDFTDRFGLPNAQNVFYIYELPAVHGQLRYLRLSVDEDLDRIRSACVVSEFDWMYMLWELK